MTATEAVQEKFDYNPYRQQLREKAVDIAIRLTVIDSEGTATGMTEEKIIESSEKVYQWLVKNIPNE